MPKGRRTAMKRLSLIVVTLLAVGASGAWAQDVRYNFAKDAKFSDFKTYKWVDIKGTDHFDEIQQKQVVAAIDSELAAKGLTRTDSDDADLYIGYQTAIREEKQFNSYSTGWGYGPGWGTGWYGPDGRYGVYGGGMNTTTTTGSTSTIQIGQLDLDMYEAKGHDLVWRGTVSHTINPKAKPDKQEKQIKKSVAKLLKNYPPPQK
jgi:hypothetical protein